MNNNNNKNKSCFSPYSEHQLSFLPLFLWGIGHCEKSSTEGKEGASRKETRSMPCAAKPVASLVSALRGTEEISTSPLSISLISKCKIPGKSLGKHQTKPNEQESFNRAHSGPPKQSGEWRKGKAQGWRDSPAVGSSVHYSRGSEHPRQIARNLLQLQSIHTSGLTGTHTHVHKHRNTQTCN